MRIQLGNYVGILYGPVVFLAKLSILLQYLRVFVPTRIGNKGLHFAIHLTIWTNLIFYVVDTFIEILQCTPRERIWNPLTAGSCAVNINAALIATAVVNAVSDLVILALPFSSIWRLRMSGWEKLKISTVFAIGLL